MYRSLFTLSLRLKLLFILFAFFIGIKNFNSSMFDLHQLPPHPKKRRKTMNLFVSQEFLVVSASLKESLFCISSFVFLLFSDWNSQRSNHLPTSHESVFISSETFNVPNPKRGIIACCHRLYLIFFLFSLELIF